jgi:hypothetical protein
MRRHLLLVSINSYLLEAGLQFAVLAKAIP